MAWQIQSKGAKAAVAAAVADAKSFEADRPSIDEAKAIILRIIELLPETQNGAEVYAAGNEQRIALLQVTGQALAL